METGSIELTNGQLILVDNSQYFYSVKAVEITNALGALKLSCLSIQSQITIPRTINYARQKKVIGMTSRRQILWLKIQYYCR